MKIKSLSCGLIALTFSGLSVTAQTHDAAINQWESHPIQMRYSGDGYSDKRKANFDYGEALFTTSQTEPGLYFRCLDGKLRAGVVFKPQDMRRTFSNLSVSGVSGGGGFVPVEKNLIYVDMKLDDGDKIGLGRWLYSKDLKAAISRKRLPAAKLYNAVVKKQKITVDINRADPVTLSIPKINTAFADFGSECGMGRNK